MISRRSIFAMTSAIAVSFSVPTSAYADDPISVVATFSILGDMVQQVGGDHIALTTLVGPDGDAHVYQPTPKDAQSVAGADVMFTNGLEFEGWLARLAEAAPFKGTEIVATAGIDAIAFEEEGHDDDHKEGDDNDEHGHGEHAFEWAGLFDLKAGTYKWSFAKVGGDYADPAMKMVVLSAMDIESVEENAETLLESDTADAKSDGDVLVAQSMAYSLNFDPAKDMTVFTVEIAEDGTYAFFTEHMPFEFEATEHFFKDTSGSDVEPIAQEPESAAGHHHHGEFDPHAWQSIPNVIVYVNNIAEGLAAADPENAADYMANRDAYIAELTALDGEIKAMVATLDDDQRTVVTSHDAFGYFTQAYGVEFKAPQGVSTESEASAADVAALITQIRDDNISAVFVENITDNRLLEQIAAETGVVIGGSLFSDALSGPNGPASTYVDMMRHNAMTITSALGQ